MRLPRVTTWRELADEQERRNCGAAARSALDVSDARVPLVRPAAAGARGHIADLAVALVEVPASTVGARHVANPRVAFVDLPAPP